MKLLLDENLSRRLIGQVADLFPGTVHVSSVNLLQASMSSTNGSMFSNVCSPT